jgi:hypothetical protein
MQGAKEYAELFTTGQYGRLYMQADIRDDGRRTFRIWVVPASAQFRDTMSRIRASVEVYGIVSGANTGNETYGWLRRGRWVADVEAMAGELRAQAVTLAAARTQAIADAAAAEEARIAEVLASY